MHRRGGAPLPPRIPRGRTRTVSCPRGLYRGDDARLAEALRAGVVRLGVGDVDEADDDLRHVLHRRDLVILEGRGHDAPGRPIDDALLHEGVAERLDDTALDL